MINSGSRTERWVARHWPAIHACGRGRFVLVKGLALWGGLMFAAIGAMLLWRFGIHDPRLPMLLALNLGLCVVGGLCWGLLTWTLNERVYRALETTKTLP